MRALNHVQLFAITLGDGGEIFVNQLLACTNICILGTRLLKFLQLCFCILLTLLQVAFAILDELFLVFKQHFFKFGKIGKLLIAEDKSTPQTIRKLPSQWAANETVIPPKAQSVTGSAIAELLDSKPQYKNLLIQARRLYWRHLNNQFRDVYRAYRDIHKDSFPAYAPSAAQMDNMEQLAALLEDHEMADELELSEIYREMGQPLKARAKLAKVGEEDKKLCAMQLTLHEMGYQGPARLNY